MPVLSEAQRDQIAQRFMQETSALGESMSYPKAEVRAAVAAQDDWRIANQASGNNALPPEFKAEATVAQKSRMMTLIFYEAYQVDAEAEA